VTVEGMIGLTEGEDTGACVYNTHTYMYVYIYAYWYICICYTLMYICTRTYI